MSKFRTSRTWLKASAAVCALSMAAPGLAFAQDADEEEEDREVITVTGIRASIESSLDAKRENTSIVEAITAEDIGKLPDVSIADSLARLPGVTAQRVRGRAQQISIRGLGPDFSLALLNGREVVSSGNNRGIEFDQFPSELIAQGIVYKTPDARLAATGIAGAVDLRSIQPLDFDDRQLNFSAKYVWNNREQLNPDFNADGYRYFGSYIDQTDDGTLGWYLGVTHQSNPTQFISRELKVSNGQSSLDGVSGTFYPTDNPRTGVVSREFERTSVAGALQFDPNDQISASIDMFYTDTEDSGIFRGVETPLAGWSGANFVGATGVAGEYAEVALYDDVGVFLRTDTESASAEIFSIGGNFEYQVSDTFSLMVDVAHSSLDRSDIDYESYAGAGGSILGSGSPLLDTVGFYIPSNGRYQIDAETDYTNPNNVVLTDPGGWGQVGFINEPTVDDELNQLRFEAEKETNSGPFSSFTGGVIFTQREKNFLNMRTFIRNNDSWNIADPMNTNSRFLAIPENLILGQTGDGGTNIPIVAYNPASLLTDGTYTLDPADNPPSWSVEEEVVTLYGMANIDRDVDGVPVRGNIGFQYVDTTQSSTGTLAGTGTQTVEYSFENFLPSANLSIEFAENFFVRLAAAKTMTRARLDQLAANQSLNFNSLVCADTDTDGVPDTYDQSAVNISTGQTCFSLGGGNPYLEPYQSTSFDLAFEKYFDDTTALSIALFRKNLEDWVLDRRLIVDGTQQIDAGGFGGFLDNNPSTAVTTLNGPVNFADGSISGIEATLRMSLDHLMPEELAGFGFNASYTYADAELDDGNGNVIDIPGYSEEVWSADVYYENHGFRARVSTRSRSDYLAEVLQFDANLIGARADGSMVVDAQLGYEWDDGLLEGLNVNFEAYNITDEPFVTLGTNSGIGAPSFPSRHELYGTTYSLTVSKKF